MRISKFFNAVIGVFVLTSCSTTYYYADFISPSEIYIPSKIYTVGMLNRGADSTMAAAIYTNGIPIDHIKGLPQAVVQKTLSDLEAKIKKLNRFNLVPIAWDQVSHDAEQFMAEPLTSAQIDSLCDAYQVDGIVAIEGANLTIRTDGEVNVVLAMDWTGRLIRVPQFSSSQRVAYSVGWRFYDGLLLEVTDVYEQTYQHFFNRTAYNPTVAANISLEDMQLFEIATDAAEDYYNRISPHWEPGYRLYYRGNTEKLLSISRRLEYSRNWPAAAAEWVKLTNSDNLTVKFYATYNMAVASEMLGKPRLAMEWLEKAKAIKDNRRVAKYTDVLKKQILVYEVVDEQLGLD